ncbi:achaete-scute homolog 3-like [Stylophora pistillata]|uniref:achaete-scute homolog 3-like n=1 Tax=Stylophora pistillata TaxID=50429 RepID=UPI000C04ABC2|nr:achaete-scute homolog 3-like [Stylophora pistillata]
MEYPDFAFSMPTCYQLGIPSENAPLGQLPPYYGPPMTMPIPHPLYDYNLEPAFIRKRNERERIRVRHVNEGYARLREHLPDEPTDKRMSKVETLRAAIRYIKHLESLLDVGKDEKQDKNAADTEEKRQKSIDEER